MNSSTVATDSLGRCTLVIMAKAPRAGMVKTRLAQRLAVDAVTQLYLCLLQDTIALARSMGATDVAIMCPASDLEEMSRLATTNVAVVAQSGDGLAAGLTSVFDRFASTGRRVVAFNSDSPHLPVSILERAFDALATHDIVVGPTHDGGYYLVGAKRACPTLFKGDGMGTKSALEVLLTRARALNLSIGFMDPFYDIDVEGDLTRLAEELHLDPKRAPRTAEWLRRWEQMEVKLRPDTRNL